MRGLTKSISISSSFAFRPPIYSLLKEAGQFYGLMSKPYTYHEGKPRRHIRIEKPTIRSEEEEKLWREVHRYAGLIPFEPDPNMGRVVEIREEIEKGTYFTPEMIEETAARLAIRFMKKE